MDRQGDGQLESHSQGFIQATTPTNQVTLDKSQLPRCHYLSCKMGVNTGSS